MTGERIVVTGLFLRVVLYFLGSESRSGMYVEQEFGGRISRIYSFPVTHGDTFYDHKVFEA